MKGFKTSVFLVMVVLFAGTAYSASSLVVDSPSTMCGDKYHDTILINDTVTVCQYNGTSFTGVLNLTASKWVNITSNGKIDGNSKGYRGGGGGDIGEGYGENNCDAAQGQDGESPFDGGGRNGRGNSDGTCGNGETVGTGGGGAGSESDGETSGGLGGAGGVEYKNLLRYNFSAGSGGGGGGAETFAGGDSQEPTAESGDGGRGGAGVAIIGNTIQVQGTVDVAGQDGGDGFISGDIDVSDEGAAGGGGGGSAGNIYVDASDVNVSFSTFLLQGGGRGDDDCVDCGDSSRGGLGSSGHLKIFYRLLSNSSSTVTYGSLGGDTTFNTTTTPNLPPRFESTDASPSTLGEGEVVNITVNVTDRDVDGIKKVLINITDPASNIEVTNANMINASITKKWYYEYTIPKDNENFGVYDADLVVFDNQDATASATENFTVEDNTPPLWRNLRDVGIIDTDKSTDLRAQGFDNLALDYAVLSTNETGSWKNYSGSYNSILDMGDAADTWTWSNFSWSNTSINSRTLIAYRIWYNDTAGNLNRTDTDTFTADPPPIVRTIKIWNETYDREGRIDENHDGTTRIHIQVNVTDEDGRDDIDTVLLNITDPAGNLDFSNYNTSAIQNITFNGIEGKTFEANITLPELTGDAGEWNVTARANDSVGISRVNSTSFIFQLVNSFQGNLNQETGQDIFEDIAFDRSDTFENPSSTPYSSVTVQVAVPSDVRNNTIVLRDPSNNKIDFRKNLSDNANTVTWTITSIAASSSKKYSFDFDIENLSISETNFTIVSGDKKIEHIQYNLSTRGPTDFVDLEAFRDISSPNKITQTELYENSSEITSDPDYEFRLEDNDGDGLDERALFTVPVIDSRLHYEILVFRGNPLKVFVDDVITNPPVREAKFVEWRRGVKFWNRNNFDLDANYKSRVPLRSSNILVDGSLELKQFDSQGSYVSLTPTVPSNSNVTRFIEFDTESISVEVKRSPPSRFFADKDTGETINVTFINNINLGMENVEATINILEADNLEVKDGNKVLHEEDNVEGTYTFNVSEVKARSSKTVNVEFDIPVADITFVGEKNISTGNALAVWRVVSETGVSRQNVWLETQRFDCIDATRAYNIDTNETLDIRCGADDSTIVEIGELTPNQVIRVGVEHRPYDPVVGGADTLISTIAANILPISLGSLITVLAIVLYRDNKGPVERIQDVRDNYL